MRSGYLPVKLMKEGLRFIRKLIKRCLRQIRQNDIWRRKTLIMRNKRLNSFYTILHRQDAIAMRSAKGTGWLEKKSLLMTMKTSAS